MKSALPKVLHRVGGLALIDHVIRTARTVSPDTVTVVTGHASARVQQHLVINQNIQTALQEPQRGTAHALQQVEPLMTGKTGTLVLLSGDVPLLSPATLSKFGQ